MKDKKGMKVAGILFLIAGIIEGMIIVNHLIDGKFNFSDDLTTIILTVVFLVSGTVQIMKN